MARTPYGRGLAEALVPTTDPSVVAESLRDTEEAFTYINKYGPLPLGSLPDITNALSYTKAGGVLTMRALLDIAIFLRGRLIRIYVQWKMQSLSSLKLS